MKRLSALVILAAIAISAIVVTGQGINTLAQSSATRSVGLYSAYNYSRWTVPVASGPVAAASPATFTLVRGTVTLPDGRTIVPFFVNDIVNIGSGANQEAVTITAVNNCYLGAPLNSCTISGNTSNSHGQGDLVASGTFGLYEAVNDAHVNNGGVASIDGSFGGTSANIINARALFSNAGVLNGRVGVLNFSEQLIAVGTGTCTSSTTLYLESTGAATSLCTNTTATNITAIANHAGTLRNLTCTATTGGVSSSSGVVTVGLAPVATGTYADTSITATFGTGTTASDTTHSAAAALGQPIRIKVTTQGSETLAGVVCIVDIM